MHEGFRSMFDSVRAFAAKSDPSFCCTREVCPSCGGSRAVDITRFPDLGLGGIHPIRPAALSDVEDLREAYRSE